ncbi:MAG TPA: rRNA maturation RNase YbeY [Bacteroidales bacterium]|nr:rRNA maturation RNase YbeY [Bacteroidales bacterium]
MPALKKRVIKTWVSEIIENHEKKSGNINFIFTTDDMLLEINKKYLNHDYYTDIITFDYSTNRLIHGDIYISLDRVNENASTLNTGTTELFRVMIHGVLHLLGYDDSDNESQEKMRKAEDQCITLLLNK